MIHKEKVHNPIQLQNFKLFGHLYVQLNKLENNLNELRVLVFVKLVNSNAINNFQLIFKY